MKCVKCGYENDDNAVFCKHCGDRLGEKSDYQNNILHKGRSWNAVVKSLEVKYNKYFLIVVFSLFGLASICSIVGLFGDLFRVGGYMINNIGIITYVDYGIPFTYFYGGAFKDFALIDRYVGSVFTLFVLIMQYISYYALLVASILFPILFAVSNFKQLKKKRSIKTKSMSFLVLIQAIYLVLLFAYGFESNLVHFGWGTILIISSLCMNTCALLSFNYQNLTIKNDRNVLLGLIFRTISIVSVVIMIILSTTLIGPFSPFSIVLNYFNNAMTTFDGLNHDFSLYFILLVLELIMGYGAAMALVLFKCKNLRSGSSTILAFLGIAFLCYYLSFVILFTNKSVVGNLDISLNGIIIMVLLPLTVCIDFLGCKFLKQ